MKYLRNKKILLSGALILCLLIYVGSKSAIHCLSEPNADAFLHSVYFRTLSHAGSEVNLRSVVYSDALYSPLQKKGVLIIFHEELVKIPSETEPNPEVKPWLTVVAGRLRYTLTSDGAIFIHQ